MTSFEVYRRQPGQRPGSTRADTIALISPGIVYSFASRSTGRPSSRSVDEVTGPIETKRTSSSGLAFRGRGRPRRTFFPVKFAKFLTVEELVKVITSGRRFEFFRIARSLVREDRGITVS